jgi:glycosyltransferase involved in cell wall biosynthesis
VRIVQLVENLRVGGLERMALDLAVAHQQAGHHSIIYCMLEAGDLAVEAGNLGIPVVAFQKPPGFSLKFIWRLAQQLRKDGVQAIHGHNPGVHHYAALAAKLAGTKAVVNTRHGVSMSDGRPFNDQWFRRVLPLTSQVAYVSDHSRHYYESNGIVPPEKGVTLVNGIRLDAYRNRAAKPGARRPKLVFGTVGRLQKVKGHADLLRAFQKVHQQMPDTELRIIGYGPLESELKALIEQLQLQGKALLLGGRSDIADQLADLDLFVFSSLSEGLPMTTLEALAAGLPIVSTRVGGVPEVAPEGDVALFSPPGDFEALADNLLVMAQRKDLAEIGSRARQLAFEKYSIESMQKSYEAIYRRFQ